MPIRSLDRAGSKQPRARRGWRPATIEALEGRALLATTALDPTFGTGGAVFGTSQPFEGNAVTAIATQADGRIVTAEVNVTPGGTAGLARLMIRRYGSNGLLDTSFGINGQTEVPFTGYDLADFFNISALPDNLVITADGSILVAAEAATSTLAAPQQFQDVVARLTSAGALDTTFGTGGLVTLPASVRSVNSVAVEAGSGRVVVAGTIPGNTGGNTQRYSVPVVVGLTSSGTIDTSFGTNGEVLVPQAADVQASQILTGINVLGLQATPTGQLILGVAAYARSSSIGGNGVYTGSSEFTITRLGTGGVFDTTFGTGGTLNVNNDLSTLGDFTLDAQGSILLAGTRDVGSVNTPRPTPALVRLRPDGTADASIASPVNAGDPGSFVRVVTAADGTITASTSTNNLYRFAASGALDTGFGQGGRISITVPVPSLPANTSVVYPLFYYGLAVTPTDNVLVGGGFNTITSPSSGASGPTSNASQSFLVQYLPIRLGQVVNDYLGDGKSDIAAQLTRLGVFAYRPSLGPDVAQFFGIPGTDQTISAPGDYDGDGKADIAAFFPDSGILAYRPSAGGADVYVRFGPTGVGNAIPAPGDYDGDGRTDVALFLPGPATFVVMPSSGVAPYAIDFGAGLGRSVAAPGDYDGDGRTDIAVYIPELAALIYHPSSTPAGTPDVDEGFGIAGPGRTLVAPGDYDGDGRDDVAAFLPELGILAYRPSGATAGAPDIYSRFGPDGLGLAVPVPGDYDGDGKADVALFLPAGAVYAILPSGGGTPYAQQFGIPGGGNTVPATVVRPAPAVLPITVSAASLRAPAPDPNAGLVVYYQPDAALNPPADRLSEARLQEVPTTVRRRPHPSRGWGRVVRLGNLGF